MAPGKGVGSTAMMKINQGERNRGYKGEIIAYFENIKKRKLLTKLTKRGSTSNKKALIAFLSDKLLR